MWNLYNLINAWDIVKGQIVWKIKKEHDTGMVDNKKKKINARIRVLKIDFDGEGNKMWIFGQTVGESNSMKEGSHQAMEIFPPKKITLVKTRFDDIHL